MRLKDVQLTGEGFQDRKLSHIALLPCDNVPTASADQAAAERQGRYGNIPPYGL